MVTIKDMEMPRWCGECGMCKEETIEGVTSTYCESLNQDITWNGNRVDNCPLVEIEERKVGKWLVKDNGNGGKYVECPFCGALAPSTEFADKTVWKYSKFCYDCGNELRGSENVSS